MKRIIQVGVGGMGGCWTDRIAESNLWEAAAYVDVNRENLEAASKRHGLPKSRCFASLDAALDKVSADALLDVTPQRFRREVCEKALKRGLDVMSEKPLADNLANAKAIIACAEKCGRTFMVAQNYRYQPIMQAAKYEIANGRIGTVGYVGVSFHKGPHFGGYREEMDYPLVLDMSIHHFDLMRSFFDCDIETVQAVSLNTPWNWNKGDATIMAQLTLSNGVIVNYFGSWIATGSETTWNADWRFDGSKGVMQIEQDTLYFSADPARRRRVSAPSFVASHQAYLLEAFDRALDSGQEPETSGRRNLNSLAATYAVVAAAQQHRPIKVNELLK